jgi:putative 4-mercaptohistidine N1-methyltranferase
MSPTPDADGTVRARDRGALHTAKRTYEADRLVADYLGFHYGEPPLPEVADFHRTLAGMCLGLTDRHGVDRGVALDLGCGPGRVAFELALVFDRVVAVDLSASFVDAATRLRAGERIDYDVVLEGRRSERRTASLADHGLATTADRVEPIEADAISFLAGAGAADGFDLVVAANLLDRVDDPALLVRRCVEATRPGGLLVLATPFTWLGEYTREANWLGTAERPGRDHLTDLLTPSCRPAMDPVDLPFVIAETERKFQYVSSFCSAWIKQD